MRVPTFPFGSLIPSLTSSFQVLDQTIAREVIQRSI
ncbi:MAG: hypothetical protein ACI9DF_006163, partial [Verrucomicrobiales bacterium]